MSKDLTIFGLALLVCILSWRLISKPVEPPCPPQEKRDDPLDLAGFEARQNRFSREIAMEERLGKK